jgi:hypothetical protein
MSQISSTLRAMLQIHRLEQRQTAFRLSMSPFSPEAILWTPSNGAIVLQESC